MYEGVIVKQIRFNLVWKVIASDKHQFEDRIDALLQEKRKLKFRVPVN